MAAHVTQQSCTISFLVHTQIYWKRLVSTLCFTLLLLGRTMGIMQQENNQICFQFWWEHLLHLAKYYSLFCRFYAFHQIVFKKKISSLRINKHKCEKVSVVRNTNLKHSVIKRMSSNCSQFLTLSCPFPSSFGVEWETGWVNEFLFVRPRLMLHITISKTSKWSCFYFYCLDFDCFLNVFCSQSMIWTLILEA